MSVPVTLQHVRDIEEYEGPLLSEYRSDSGESYLYRWCDRHGVVDRWLVVRMPPQDINQYLVGLLNLRHLILNCRDQFVYLVDSADEKIIASFHVSPSVLPKSYLPSASSRFNMRDASTDLTHSEFQEVFVSEHWGHQELAIYPRRYLQAYTIHALFGTCGDATALEQIGYNLTQGYVFGALFSTLGSMVPAQKRASMEAISVASPGYVRFKVDPQIAASVRQSVARYIASRESIESQNYVLGRWVNRHEEVSSERVEEAVRAVGDAMGIRTEELVARSDKMGTAVKTLRSYLVRIQYLAGRDAQRSAMLVGLPREPHVQD